VISPSKSSNDVLKKVRRYIQAGTRMVWTVYREDQTVYVWQAADDGGLHAQPFGAEDALDGGDVLPGFRLMVSEIFPK
jgi:Uma2 family endonuclease